MTIPDARSPRLAALLAAAALAVTGAVATDSACAAAATTGQAAATTTSTGADASSLGLYGGPRSCVWRYGHRVCRYRF